MQKLKKKIILTVAQATDPALSVALNKIAVLRLPDLKANWSIGQLLTDIEGVTKTFHTTRAAIFRKYGIVAVIVPPEKKEAIDAEKAQYDLKTRAGRDAFRAVKLALGCEESKRGDIEIDPDNMGAFSAEMQAVIDEQIKVSLREPIVVPLDAFNVLPPTNQLTGAECLALQKLVVIPELMDGEDEPTAEDKITAGNYKMDFKNAAGESIGVLDFSGERLAFTGNADESAQKFIELLGLKLAGNVVELPPFPENRETSQP